MAIMLTIVNCNRSGGSSLRVLTAACANRGSKTQLTAQFTKFQENNTLCLFKDGWEYDNNIRIKYLRKG